MNYNSDYGMMDLNLLAQYYNQLLGEDYLVRVNSIEIPENKRTSVTLRAARVPFSISDVKAETLNVQLNFRVKLQPRAHKEKVIADMGKLIGCKRFDLERYAPDADGNPILGKTFRVHSYLDMQAPISDPVVDSGDLYNDYQVTGTVLVSDADGGAVMSNDIQTSLNGSALAVVSCQMQLQKSVEAPSSLDDFIVSPLVKSKGSTYAIVALNLGRTIDYEIMKRIELSGEGEETIFMLKRQYPNGVVVDKSCVLLDGTVAESAGAYTQYTLTLQEV